MGSSQLSQKGKTTQRTILQIPGNQHNVRGLAAEHLQSLFCFHRRAYNLEPTLACQGSTQQLASHQVLVCDENRHRAWGL
jgi:hypothetical protein